MYDFNKFTAAFLIKLANNFETELWKPILQGIVYSFLDPEYRLNLEMPGSGPGIKEGSTWIFQREDTGDFGPQTLNVLWIWERPYGTQFSEGALKLRFEVDSNLTINLQEIDLEYSSGGFKRKVAQIWKEAIVGCRK